MNPTTKDAATITRISGALVEARPLGRVGLREVVHVGPRRLLGEVIRLDGDRATLQVYEETGGLCLGAEVVPSGAPLEVELGPGLLGGVIDGVGRPLQALAEQQGDFLVPGAAAPTLPVDRRWDLTPTVEAGRMVEPGDVLGTVELGAGRVHRVTLPPGRSGVVAGIGAGAFGAWEPFGALDDGRPLTLAHRWPVRVPRPVAGRLPGTHPLVTGQRILDLLFPVAEGGLAAVPGGFGTGKTVIEQSLARYARADIVVYIGCGERGNEMADLLGELPELPDPQGGGRLSDRTVLVINTSNMPVAAREASVYLGMTIAEYFRDQGLRVALLADSLSRWAEALREIGSRLGEMPGEEGYPTSLSSRLGALYERAGRVRCLGRPERTGAVTFIAALSPPGGDFSEPVTQASLRVAGAVWALDARLANQRQFPAVSWDQSFTGYAPQTAAYFEAHGGEGWGEVRQRVLALLQQERELRDVAELVGLDSLEDGDRLLIAVASLVRQVVIGQSAFDPHDAASELDKTWTLARLSLDAHDAARARLQGGAGWGDLDLQPVRDAIAAVRDAAPDDRAARVAEATEAVRGLRPEGGA